MLLSLFKDHSLEVVEGEFLRMQLSRNIRKHSEMCHMEKIFVFM